MTTTHTTTSASTNGVYFIDKDNTWSIFLSLGKQVSDSAGTNTDKHFNEFRTGNAKERHISLTSNRSRQHSFAGTWWTDQQHTFRDTGSDTSKFFRKLQKLDYLL